MEAEAITQANIETIVTPQANRAPVWGYFGYTKDATGKIAFGKKVKCKLCRADFAHSGGSTNLKNHLRSHHRAEYTALYSDDDTVLGQSQQKMDVFCKQRPAEKLLPGSARAQELTSAVVDFVIQDLRPASVVDNVGFLHLMEVTEPRYSVPCRRTINSYIDKRYLLVCSRSSSK